MRRPSGELVQRSLNSPIQLGIGAAGIILWRIVNFDVGISPVVLHAPADVVEEERELRLCGDRAVDQSVPRPDADYPAPGALAHQRAQLHQLEGVREDIAIRAG